MLPKEFEERMRGMLKEEYEAFVEGFSGPEFKGLRRNPLKITESDFMGLLPFSLQKIPWCGTGYYYEDCHPGKHPFHEAGLFYIQEPSAMSVAEYLEAKPGERVLDLCAAPGGKTTQIAGKMEGKGLLVCNEIHPQRARILSENMERMGVRNAIVTNETPDSLALRFPGFFDKILVDAPCSGEGMFRKNQEALSQWSSENVDMCEKRQDEILKEAVKMLRPGGRICYSTCTFAPQENEACAERFLDRYPEFSLLGVEKKEGMDGGNPLWTKSGREDIARTLRLWPHKLKGEGHFIAVFEKRGGQDAISQSGFKGGQAAIPWGGFEKVQKLADFQELQAFIRESLRIEIEDRILLFGEQLYLLPKEAPSLKGLKVLRPGLHLGVLKKKRFEPSHALALALKKEEAVFTYDMKAESQEVKTYLAGGTFPHEGPKGWYLMTVEGYSIGWGKLAGGILKNHYPRGLRKSLEVS